jgi:hypothetical protein
VRGATKVVDDAEQGVTLPGNPDGWLHIREYAHASRPRMNQGHEYRYRVYVDGHRVDEVRDIEPDQTPPADLQSRHLWPVPFPSFEAPGAANVKAAPYGAKGDGRADDTTAIQRAINENEIVFLPKGCYRLTRTVELKPHTKLIGVGQHLSFLLATGDEAFADAQNPAPLVRTADTARADTILAFLGLLAPNNVPGATALHWRCGGHSVYRGVEVSRQAIHGFAPAPRGSPKPVQRSERPPVLVTSHGGGNWYNYRYSTWAGDAPNYRQLLVDGASGPLRFYQFSPQHATSDYAAEVRGSRHVWIFGTKYEGNVPMLLVRDGDDIRLFGHGGNAKALPGAALFIFERTPNFLFANGVDGPTKIGSRSLSHPQGSTDPRRWHMLIERSADGEEFKLPPLERPVLYRRGAPSMDELESAVSNLAGGSPE